MPHPGTTDPKKRRVRTGCLTCRTRRRKCDEKKPVCNNCTGKGLQCKYGVNIVFVEDKRSIRQPSSAGLYQQHEAEVSPTSPKPASSQDERDINDQVNDGMEIVESETQDIEPGHVAEHGHELKTIFRLSETASPGPLPSIQRVLSGQTSRTDASAQSPLGSNNVQQLQFFQGIGTPSIMNQPQKSPLFDGVMSPTFAIKPTPVRAHRPLRGVQVENQRFLPPVTIIKSYQQSPIAVPSNSSQYSEPSELDLVCLFRYHVAPWLDLGDTSLHFGVRVSSEASKHQELYHALLGITTWKLLLCPQISNNAYFVSEKTASTFLESASRSYVALESSPILTLLFAAEILMHEPRTWPEIAQKHLAVATQQFTVPITTNVTDVDCWVALRFDIAASLISNQPLTIAWQTQFLSQGMQTPSETPEGCFRIVLSILARAIAAVQPHHEENTPNSAMPLSMQWTNIWNECQDWYFYRSAIMQAILDIPTVGLDADQSNPNEALSFPTILFSSALTTLSTAVYHIACLFLLLHKPRLIKPRFFASTNGVPGSDSIIWHSQRILGIAANTHDPVAWDPLLVAGVLLASSRLSHRGQKQCVAEILGRTADMTGMQLQREADKLESLDSNSSNEMQLG